MNRWKYPYHSIEILREKMMKEHAIRSIPLKENLTACYSKNEFAVLFVSVYICHERGENILDETSSYATEGLLKTL
jgi:hypothetical protein